MAVVRKLGALAFLGYRAAIAHPLQLLLRDRDQRGKAAFLDNYATLGLVPVKAVERQQLTSFMKCVDCGLCDEVCPLVGTLDRRNFAGPSLVALAYARATPDLETVSSTLAHLPADCGSCTRCVDVCPTRVPLRDLFSYANGKIAETRAARAGTLAGSAPALPLPSGIHQSH